MLLLDLAQRDNPRFFYRAVIRFLLLLKYKSGIQYSPPIPLLKRGKYLKEKLNNPSPEEDTEEETQVCSYKDQYT